MTDLVTERTHVEAGWSAPDATATLAVVTGDDAHIAPAWLR